MKAFQVTKTIVLILTPILLFAGCAVRTKTGESSHISGPTVIQKPVVADLDVKETRVTGTATAKSSEKISAIKQLAVADALSKSNADVLIEPRFETVTALRKTTVTVTGYPATYKNFRPMEIEDTLFIVPTNHQFSASNEAVEKRNVVAKKTALFSTIGVLGISALLIWFL